MSNRLKKSIVKKQIIKDLKDQGFVVNKSGNIVLDANIQKTGIRLLHSHFRDEKIKSEATFIRKTIGRLKMYFADGSEIDTDNIKPCIHLVKPNTELSDLFRLTSLLWSIPVSKGFGRRIRFVVTDENNGKLIGIFALGDPVFNLKARDSLIGWDQNKRKQRLYNVLDIYILGAVPPYSQLLGGKLIAMLTASTFVRKIVWAKYLNVITTIEQKNKTPHLVLLTTLSAMGRSSLYNRIKYDNRHLFIRIGETSGWGHFHLANSTFDLIIDYLEYKDHPIVKRNRFGQGPNWKIRTIRTCLELLELPTTLLNHGIKRDVYICPLADNYIDYLNGEVHNPLYYKYNVRELCDYHKKRWLIPRAKRMPAFRDVRSEKTLKDLLIYL